MAARYDRRMLTAATFDPLARSTLTALQDRLDAAYESGALEELELEAGVLTIMTATGKSFIVSAHGPSMEIWLASPLSGGLHFRWNGNAWALPDGALLDDVLARDLQSQGVELVHA